MQLPNYAAIFSLRRQEGIIPLLPLIGLAFLAVGVVITLRLIEQNNVDLGAKAASDKNIIAPVSANEEDLPITPTLSPKTFQNLR